MNEKYTPRQFKIKQSSIDKMNEIKEKSGRNQQWIVNAALEYFFEHEWDRLTQWSYFRGADPAFWCFSPATGKNFFWRGLHLQSYYLHWKKIRGGTPMGIKITNWHLKLDGECSILVSKQRFFRHTDVPNRMFQFVRYSKEIGGGCN